MQTVKSGDMKQTIWPLPFYIAHRGASMLAPENTIAALKKAKAEGAEAVEFDVQLTRDHAVIVFHDDTLLRTTNGHGRVSKATLEKLALLDAGSWFSDQYKNERIPTLQAWLETASQLQLALNLEIKCTTKKEAMILADLIIDHLKKYWPLHSNAMLISSSNYFALMQLNERSTFSLGLITETILSEKDMRMLYRSRIASVHQPHDMLTSEYVDTLHSNELRVLAYTVNELSRADELKRMGVDGIFSDNLFHA